MKFQVPSVDKHHMVHHAHTVAHLSYLGAASFHGGFYGLAAMVLIAIIICGMFIGESL